MGLVVLVFSLGTYFVLTRFTPSDEALRSRESHDNEWVEGNYHQFGPDEWAWDELGALVDVVSLVDSPESGASLLRYCAKQGQVLGRDGESLFVDFKTLVIVIALRLEEFDGTNIADEYANVGECHPVYTKYGR